MTGKKKMTLPDGWAEPGLFDVAPDGAIIYPEPPAEGDPPPEEQHDDYEPEAWKRADDQDEADYHTGPAVQAA